MSATLEGKKIVGARSADKVMYYYKLIKHEKTGTPCHILGTQGASSGTNTKTLGTTPTKMFNVKATGSINQQRVVNVVMTTGDGFKTDVACTTPGSTAKKCFCTGWTGTLCGLPTASKLLMRKWLLCLFQHFQKLKPLTLQ